MDEEPEMHIQFLLRNLQERRNKGGHNVWGVKWSIRGPTQKKNETVPVTLSI